MVKQSTRKRPFGVIVIIVLQSISVLGLIVDVVLVQADRPSLYLRGIEHPTLFSAIASLAILYQLIVIFGLWHLRRWAWFLIMIQLGISMGTDLWLYADGDPLYLNMLLNVARVFYLNQREVQQIFERRPRSREATWTI